MTDKPHRLLLIDVSAAGHSRDYRDAGGMKGEVVQSEGIKDSAPVAGSVSGKLPGTEAFFFFKFRDQWNQCGVQTGRVTTASFERKGNKLALGIDIAQGKCRLGQPASLVPGNVPAYGHPFRQVGKRGFNDFGLGLSDLGFFSRGFLFESQLGGGIDRDQVSVDGFVEDQSQDDKVMDGGIGGGFQLSGIKIGETMGSLDLIGEGDALGFEESKQVLPCQGITFKGVRLLGKTSVDPSLNPRLELLIVGTSDRGLHLFHLTLRPELAGHAGLLNGIHPAAGRFLTTPSISVDVFDPPVGGFRPGIKAGHLSSVGSVGKSNRKTKNPSVMNRENQNAGQRRPHSWFESMRGSHYSNRVESDISKECRAECRESYAGGLK